MHPGLRGLLWTGACWAVAFAIAARSASILGRFPRRQVTLLMLFGAAMSFGYSLTAAKIGEKWAGAIFVTIGFGLYAVLVVVLIMMCGD